MKNNGAQHDLLRADDHEGEVLESFRSLVMPMIGTSMKRLFLIRLLLQGWADSTSD